MTIGQRIKAERKEQKLTLGKLAQLAGTSTGYIWELENNDKIKMSADLLKRIALALEVSADYLLGLKDTSTLLEYSITESLLARDRVVIGMQITPGNNFLNEMQSMLKAHLKESFNKKNVREVG